MTFILLAADPDEKQWTVLMQSENADPLLDEIDKEDSSLRFIVDTNRYITFDTRKSDDE